MKTLNRSDVLSIKKAIELMTASGMLSKTESSGLLGTLQKKCGHQGAKYKPIRGTREQMDCSHCGLQEVVTI